MSEQVPGGSFESGDLVDRAMNRAFEAAVRLHRTHRVPLVIWKDERVCEIDPFEIRLADDQEGGIAHDIRALRLSRGLTQRELAEKVGTTQSVIARMEDPDYEGHSLRMLRRIAEALDAHTWTGLVPDGERDSFGSLRGTIAYQGDVVRPDPQSWESSHDEDPP